jgi:hypothetical protein
MYALAEIRGDRPENYVTTSDVIATSRQDAHYTRASRRDFFQRLLQIHQRCLSGN